MCAASVLRAAAGKPIKKNQKSNGSRETSRNGEGSPVSFGKCFVLFAFMCQLGLLLSISFSMVEGTHNGRAGRRAIYSGMRFLPLNH
jgi:hypothetical protein